jgi:hypothetical protein
MNILNIIPASRRRGDPDATDYFARIVSAGSTISVNNQAAVNAFIVGCKADGIWTAIKASCFLAGPDDLTGALVPLVGPSPTNTGFVAGDYSRAVGLTTDNVTKFLDSNFNHATNPQSNAHMVSWVPTVPNQTTMGTARSVTGSSTIYSSGRCRSQNSALFTGATPASGFFGHSQFSSSQVSYRTGGVSYTYSNTSQTPRSENVTIFRLAGGDLPSSTGTVAFYSMGESLDLAALDARLATYMASIT